MRLTLVIVYLIFGFITNANTLWLDSIKQSKNYKNNIEFIEKKLLSSHFTNETLYSIQSVLIDNYIADNQYEKSVKLCQQEILNAQKNSWSFNEANLYIALARSYYYLNQKEKVIQYNNEALQIALKNGYIDLLKRASHNIGVIAFEYENNIEKAKNYFIQALKYGKQIPETKQNNLANQYRLLATCYDMLKDFKKADSIFTLTETIYKKYNDSLGLSDVYTFHARLFLSQKKYDEALQFNKDAITIAEKYNNIEYLQTSLSMFEQINIEINNYKEAYWARKKIVDLQNLSNAKNREKDIADAEAKFKVSELQNKQRITELQNKQTQRNNIFIFIIILLIVVAIIVLVYQKRIAKKEQQIKLEGLKQIYNAEENERSRIAKDLHDNMGSYTTLILSQIDMIDYYEEDEKSKKIKDLRTDAENIMATLRETIWILKNKNVTINQFYDLIKTYADKQLVKNIQLNVEYNENITNELKQLNSTISLNLYRIVQEIIQNVIKHSQANKVMFNITCNAKLEIEISENGIGFDINNLKRKSGIEHMQQRANDIGYYIKIISQPTIGTKTTITEK